MFPDSLVALGEDSFSNSFSNSLESLTWGAGITDITKHNISTNDRLRSIVLSCGITRIEKNSVNGCSNLESVVISNSVEVIEAYAFNLCVKASYFTYHEVIPAGWDKNWNDNRPVYTKDQWHFEGSIPTPNSPPSPVFV